MEVGSYGIMIGIIITIVLSLIVILPTLIGIVRGAKKSAFRLAWVVCFGLLSLAFVTLISRAVINMDITSFNIVIEGEVVTTIPKYVELTLANSGTELAQIAADNIEVFKLIISLILAVINLIVFVVIFWLLNLLLWPVWAIISHFLFKNKKIETRKIMQNGKMIAEKKHEVVQKKRAGLGALFGFFLGLFSLGVTVIPLAGISDTLIRVEQVTLTETENGEQKGLLSSALGDNVEIIYCYVNSPAGKVLGAIGLNAADTAVAKVIASTESNGQKVSALDEIVDISKLSVQVNTLVNTDYANLTKSEWTETLPAINNACDILLSSGIVKSLYDNIVPYLVDNMLSTPDYFIPLPDFGDEILNDLFKDVLLQVKTITSDDIKNDIAKTIDIIDEINNIDVWTSIVSGDITFEYVQQQLNNDFGENVNEKLFEMNSIQKLLPICLDGAIEYGCEQLEVVYVESSTALTAQQVKEFFGSLINDVIAIVKNYDNTQNIPIASGNFENIGNVVDSLKQSGVLSVGTFNNLVDYVVDKVSIEIDKWQLKDYADTFAQQVLDTIKYIPSFKNDLKHIGLAYQTYLDENFDIENMELEALSKIADKFLLTSLYQMNIDNIADCLQEMVSEYCTTYELDIDSQTIENICNEINKVTSYNREYTNAQGLIEYLEQILEQGDISSHLANEQTMQVLGQHFDQTVANGSILLSDENCKLLLKSIIQNVELPADLQGTTVNGQDILVAMSNNVNKITSYQTEFVYISKIMNVQDGGTLQEYGQSLDAAKNSVLLDGILNQVVKDKIEEKAQTISDTEISEIVASISQYVDQIESYQTEFAHLDKLVELDFDNSTLAEIGGVLDQVEGSKLLDPVISDIIILQIERNTENLTDADMLAIVEKVKDNVPNIQSYQIEFEYLQQFVDLDVENASMTQLGAMLDDFVDSTLFANTTNDMLKFALLKGEAEIDDVYTDIYTQIVENVDNVNGKIYATELTYVQSFVDFTNNGEPKTSQNIQQYLDDSILDENGNSKSVLIDDEITDLILSLANI